MQSKKRFTLELISLAIGIGAYFAYFQPSMVGQILPRSYANHKQKSRMDRLVRSILLF